MTRQPRQPRPRTTGEPRDSLKLLFFSDWRIQSLELAEQLLRSVAPVDVIVYGGDDASRFVPDVEIPFKGRVLGLDDTFEDDELGDLAQAMAKHLGCELPPDLPRIFLSQRVRDLLAHFPVPENWLTHIVSTYSRYGVVGVIGNDCLPGHRAVLRARGVYDLHAEPVVLGGWGFAGIEGGLWSTQRQKVGYVLHEDSLVKPHLAAALRQLDVPPERTVIVSHTSPTGCDLDYAIRFGFDRIGSKALRDFVRHHKPAAVLSGHCHSCGGQDAYLGSTLVVNAASDDTRHGRARACVIELSTDGVRIDWLDTYQRTMYAPDLGYTRASRLQTHGITRIEEILDAPPELLREIQFGPVRLARLRAYLQARDEQRAVWMSAPELPAKALSFDVETGIEGNGGQQPWMIGTSTGGEVHQWVALDEEPVGRRAMSGSRPWASGLTAVPGLHSLPLYAGASRASGTAPRALQGLVSFRTRRVKWTVPGWRRRTT